MVKKKTESEGGEKKLVVPGETIISGENYLPGDFTRKEGNDIVANRYGVVEIGKRVVRIIPISGVFEPRKGNVVIGRIEDISFNGWMVDIKAPYPGFLPFTECPRYINKEEIREFLSIGDMISAKIKNIAKGGIELSLKFKGLGKLVGGRIIRINPHKVPRVIGRGGSMINLIKKKSKTSIIVGQNGFIWIKGELKGENLAEKAIKMVEEGVTSTGLTERIEKFLESQNE